MDVAISPFGDVSVRLSQLSAMDFTASRFTAERLAERGHVLSEGDEVFFVGLFNLAPGRTRNQPAFRFGRISLIPDEPLLVKVGENVLYTDKAFIVECQAYPGFSGSPLFLHLPQEITPQGEGVAHIKEEAFVLLGLVSGYHKDTDNLEFEGVRRFTHYGLSVAVGVDAIADLIDHPDLVARRERFAAERTAARAAKAAAEPAVEGHALPPIDRAPRVNRAMKRSRKQSKRGR